MRLFTLLFLGSTIAPSQVQILTANGNNQRSNSNLQEYQLSPVTVNAASFGKLGAFSVDGQVYAQPLYMSGISMGDQGTRSVLFVATMHNSVYAFDADGFSSAAPATRYPLWQVSLGPPVPSQLLFGPYGDIGIEVGILGTGVIDPAHGVLLVLADTLRNGRPAYYLHALDLATGAERLNGPVQITASVAGTGSEGQPDGTIPFDPMQHLQRPGLLLLNGTVYAAFGSHGDQSPWHGWIVSYDSADLTRQAGVYMSTPQGNGGSFWQSGRGLAADDQGAIYGITGNGDYDGAHNYSQTFLKFSGANPVRTDSFTPADWQTMSDNDFDISAGPALIGRSHTVVGGDKAGNLYVLNGDALAQEALPRPVPAYFQASTGSIFNFAVWDQPGGALLFTQGSQDFLQCYQVSGTTYNATPVSSSSTPMQYSRMGITVSADGSNLQSGIVWETEGNYNTGAPGELHAYQASDLSVELWNSSMNSTRDGMGAVAKFASPTVADGKVYVPTFSGLVEVYGLLEPIVEPAPAISSVTNAASFEPLPVAPGELVAIFGSMLGPAGGAELSLDNDGLVATSLATTHVLFDGIPAPVTYASAGQVNAIVPFGVASAVTQLTVQYQGQSSGPMTLAVTQTAPGVFSADGSGAGGGLVVNQDGTLNSAANPAPPGSVVTFYATGGGPVSPLGPDGTVVTANALPLAALPVSAQVGGFPAPIRYAGGAPGMVQGVWQVNLQIPEGAPTGAAVPLVLEVGGLSSQGRITVAVGVASQQAPLPQRRPPKL